MEADAPAVKARQQLFTSLYSRGYGWGWYCIGKALRLQVDISARESSRRAICSDASALPKDYVRAQTEEDLEYRA